MLIRLQREAPPRLWHLFCREWLGLSGRKAERWWQALRSSKYSRAVEMRSAILSCPILCQSATAMEQLVRRSLSPQTWVAVLEDLILNGLRVLYIELTF